MNHKELAQKAADRIYREGLGAYPESMSSIILAAIEKAKELVEWEFGQANQQILEGAKGNRGRCETCDSIAAILTEGLATQPQPRSEPEYNLTGAGFERRKKQPPATGKPQDWQDDPGKVAAHAEFSAEVEAVKRSDPEYNLTGAEVEQPPATEQPKFKLELHECGGKLHAIKPIEQPPATDEWQKIHKEIQSNIEAARKTPEYEEEGRELATDGTAQEWTPRDVQAICENGCADDLTPEQAKVIADAHNAAVKAAYEKGRNEQTH